MLEQLLNKARFRILWNRLCAQLAASGAYFLGAVAFLLVLGTGIFSEWIPLALGVLALGFGVFQTLSGAPSLAHTAEILDRRGCLADALSTALYFRNSNEPFANAQRAQAENASAAIDLSVAVPFTTPRALYAMAACGFAVSVLLLVRYGTLHTLDLRPPIAGLNLDAFSGQAGSQEKPNPKSDEKARASRRDDLLTRLGTSTPDHPGAEDLQTPPGSAVTTGAESNNDGAAAAASPDGEKKGKPEGASDETSPSGDPAAADSSKEGSDQPPSSRDGTPQSAQSGGKSGGSPEGSGLMNKLRDAVTSLMSKMKPPSAQPSPVSAQGARQPNGKQQSGQPNGQKQGQEDAKGQSEQDGQESASSDSDQMTPGKGEAKSSDQNASSKPGSGMGHQDGSKDLKDAEQLAAMGKLSDIIGRRSAKITGEMTIESQSGQQQLRTGYTRSTAKHGRAEGDLSRDEVPVALQGYVQEYFDQVRRQAAVKAARAGKAPAQP